MVLRWPKALQWVRNWTKAAQWIDSASREIMLLAGLCILAGGLWQLYRPAALIVPGAILVAVAIFGVAPIGSDRSPR